VDFVFESIAETLDAKKEAFEKLDQICRPEVVFATNTSSIPITKLATTVKRPQNFIGVHFFNPVPAMRLVEIVRGLKTSMETVLTAEKIIHSMKKETVRVKMSGISRQSHQPGPQERSIQLPHGGRGECGGYRQGGPAGPRPPHGAFRGRRHGRLDIGLEVLRGLFNSYKDIKWRPSMLLEQLVESGDLGKKSGKGWYDYSSGEKKPRGDVKF